MREITDHKLIGLNEALTIRIIDEPGAGGANHWYKVNGPDRTIRGITAPLFECDIKFQNGPIQEAGINGISQEALLAVVIDRLRCFQAGQFSCRENAIALTHCEDALHWLQHRTRQRLARGVEGTSQK